MITKFRANVPKMLHAMALAVSSGNYAKAISLRKCVSAGSSETFAFLQDFRTVYPSLSGSIAEAARQLHQTQNLN
jgi:hypothetical protein